MNSPVQLLMVQTGHAAVNFNPTVPEREAPILLVNLRKSIYNQCHEAIYVGVIISLAGYCLFDGDSLVVLCVGLLCPGDGSEPSS